MLLLVAVVPSFILLKHKTRGDVNIMNIYAPKGAKVVFNHPTGGRTHEQETAKKYLDVGATYSIERTEVSDFHTRVHLQEVAGVTFNSVYFDDA